MRRYCKLSNQWVFLFFPPVIRTLFGYSRGRNTQQKSHGKKTKQLASLPRTASHKIIRKEKTSLLKNPADVHTATKVFWRILSSRYAALHLLPRSLKEYWRPLFRLLLWFSCTRFIRHMVIEKGTDEFRGPLRGAHPLGASRSP